MFNRKSEPKEGGVSRRRALKVLGSSVAATAAAACGTSAGGGSWWDFFQQHYREMSDAERAKTIERFEKKYSKKYGKDVDVKTTEALDGVLYGYALNISKCKGYRDCVKACMIENNTGRDPELAYIRVLEMEKGTMDLEAADHYYDHDEVPQPGKFYLPVQCMQCDDPPCVSACPVEATWREKDGLVLVDYDWCIGCRYCAVACPYQARHFNWSAPKVPKAEMNPDTHYLGNRPRQKGVIEKCTYCVHRVRENRQPACQEACPTGARVFGNLLDPKSEIRWILENKTVFRLKEELGTQPKFWYYTD